MSTLDIELSPQPDLEFDPLEDLRKKLIRDFNLSFRFSQGLTGIQRLLMIGLLAHYKETLDLDEVAQVVIDPDFQERLTHQRPPKRHVLIDKGAPHPVSKEDARISFAGQVVSFNRIITEETELEEGEKGTGLLIRICSQTIDRDYQFSVDRGFNRVYGGIDPKASYFREYILARRPTTSEAFDSVFTQASEIAWHTKLGDPLFEGMFRLANEWEYQHPGESFYPTHVPPET